MINFTSVMIGASDPHKMNDFYQPIFDIEPGWVEPNEGWFGYKVGDASIMIGPHSEVSGANKEPGRYMICLEADDPQKEFDRIKGLGAKVVRELEKVGDGEMEGQLATFEDTEGNYFQLMSAGM